MLEPIVRGSRNPRARSNESVKDRIMHEIPEAFKIDSFDTTYVGLIHSIPDETLSIGTRDKTHMKL